MTSIPLRYVVRTKTPGVCPDTPPCSRGEHWDYGYALVDGTPVAKLEPGDVYFTPDHLADYRCTWSNCDGRHLIVMLPSPNLHPWNVDGRASNCTMTEDTLHRCWVRHGDPTTPATLHVDKLGATCSAGAGSIAADGYHGFLHGGRLVQC